MPCSGGGQLTRRPHALSYDGETVVVCNAERLCVYSSITGERIFDLRGHLDEVTGICLHPRSKNQVRFVMGRFKERPPGSKSIVTTNNVGADLFLLQRRKREAVEFR